MRKLKNTFFPISSSSEAHIKEKLLKTAIVSFPSIEEANIIVVSVFHYSFFTASVKARNFPISYEYILFRACR